jgi:hypothetical protein
LNGSNETSRYEPAGFLSEVACANAPLAGNTDELQNAHIKREWAILGILTPLRVTGRPHDRLSPILQNLPFVQNFAGTENGFVASTTNMMRAVNSVLPLLKTSIVMPGLCPFIEWPASTFTTPSGVR